MAKNFRTALTTKAQMGDLEATQLVEDVMGAFPSGTSDDDLSKD